MVFNHVPASNFSCRWFIEHWCSCNVRKSISRASEIAGVMIGHIRDTSNTRATNINIAATVPQPWSVPKSLNPWDNYTIKVDYQVCPVALGALMLTFWKECIRNERHPFRKIYELFEISWALFCGWLTKILYIGTVRKVKKTTSK